MNARLRCVAVNDFPAASVSYVDWMPPSGRQLCGTLIEKLACDLNAVTDHHRILVDGGCTDLRLGTH